MSLLVTVPVYNGGMEPIVEIKVYQLGETMQVSYVMQHINVPITIWYHVHWVEIGRLSIQHANVLQRNIGSVLTEIYFNLFLSFQNGITCPDRVLFGQPCTRWPQNPVNTSTCLTAAGAGLTCTSAICPGGSNCTGGTCVCPAGATWNSTFLICAYPPVPG